MKQNVSEATQNMIENIVSNSVVNSANCVPLINALSGTNASSSNNLTSLAGVAGRLATGCGDNTLSNSTVNRAIRFISEVWDEGPQDDDDFAEVRK